MTSYCVFCRLVDFLKKFAISNYYKCIIGNKKVVKTKLNVSDDKIKQKIQQLEELFIHKFEKELEEFQGDVKKFQVFEKDLDVTFKKITKSEKWGKAIMEL